jgi:predicted phage terminase large subunit-like protein
VATSVDALSPEELKAYVELKRRELALMSPLEYGAYCSRMQRFPHVEYVDALILTAMDGRLYKSGPSNTRCVFEPDPENPDDPFEGQWVHPVTRERAIFNIALSEPPRHGKSFHISEHFPAWFLTKYPMLNFHLASYEDTFAATWGAKARDLVREHPELGVEVRREAKASRHWRIKGHRGEMKTAGAGGPITGMGRHVGVIDDLVKNAEEAMSETVRKGNVHWYLTTWKTRREPHPARMRMLYPELADMPDIFCIDISIATRWNMGDLNGWLRENEDSEWYFVNMPALAFQEEETPDYGDPGRCVLNREPGAPLCPARFNKKDLIQRRDGSGEGLFWFNALYQGVPRVEEGGIIRRPFSYYRIQTGENDSIEYHLDDGTIHAAFNCMRFATVDLAATLKTRSDYTVCAIWDVTPGPDRKLLLRARFRVKLESSDHEGWIRKWDDQFSPDFFGIEDRTFGTTLIQNLRRHGGVRVKALPADKDKLTRAMPFGYLCAEGKVFFPKDAPWLEEWEEELLSFPNARHDDQVDVAAYAALEFENLPKFTSKSRRPDPTTLDEKVSAYVDRRIREKQGKRRVRKVRFR